MYILEQPEMPAGYGRPDSHDNHSARRIGDKGISMTAQTRNLKPGQEAPVSGQYQIIGPRGAKGPERTVTRGEPMPSPPAAGSRYNLV